MHLSVTVVLTEVDASEGGISTVHSATRTVEVERRIPATGITSLDLCQALTQYVLSDLLSGGKL